jgi:large subunit ribosomal protein L6
VKVEISGQQVKVSGSKGDLSWELPAGVSVKQEGSEIIVERKDDEKESRALHGLSRALIANMVVGVSEGYSKGLELYGTGYSCAVQGNKLQLNCGFMGRGIGRPAQFEVPIPPGIQVDVKTPAARGNTQPAAFTVSGCDKQLVGQFAAEVRKIRKPEPYLGKGIRYAGEQIRRKAGKVFAGGG